MKHFAWIALLAAPIILTACLPQKRTIVEISLPSPVTVVVTATPLPTVFPPRFPEGTLFAINDESNFIFKIYDARLISGQYAYILIMVRSDKSPELLGTLWEYPATDKMIQDWLNNDEIRILDSEFF